MNTEERLKKAEDLLQAIITEANQEPMVSSSLKAIKEARKFLNPEPEILWDEVPVGTAISHNIQVNDMFLSQRGNFISTAHGHTVTKDNCTIRPQVSHIHKFPWPKDGKRPDWVKDDDLVIRVFEDGNASMTTYANEITWNSPSKWFAVIKIAEYRK